MILSLGWSLSLVSATWKLSTPAGAVAAGIGGASAVIVANLLARPRFPQDNSISLRARRCLLPPLLAAGFAWLSTWIFEHLFIFSIPFHLFVREVSVAALAAFSLVSFLRALVRRFPTMGFLEAGVAVALSVNLVSGHRQTLEHPFWLIDLFMRNGADPMVAFKVIGGAACLMVIVMLFGSYAPTRKTNSLSLASAILGGVLILSVALAVYFIAPQRPAPLVQATPPPVAPKSPDDPPPPPPPQPKIVAWVEFLDSCKASERLGGLYFRQCVIEDALEIWQLSKGGDAGNSPAGVSTPPMSADVGGRVTTRVHLMAATNVPRQPPVLLSGFGEATPLPVRDKRFASSWEVHSRAPDPLDDQQMASPRMKLIDPDWSPEDLSRLKALPLNVEFLPIAGEAILNTIEGYRKRSDSSRLAAVLDMSKVEFQVQNATWEIPEKPADPTGGIKPPTDLRELSRRAVLLLRAVDIPCRLVMGFKYPMVEDEEKSALVLADSHKTWWPEVHVKDIGWVPLVLPQEGGAKGEPPNLSTIEEMLAASLDTQPAEQPVKPQKATTERHGWKYLVACLALVWVFPLWWLLIQPAFVSARKRPMAALQAAGGLLALEGHYRNYGETRTDFAKRLPARLGEPMLRLAAAFDQTRWNDGHIPPLSDTLRPLSRITAWAIPRGIVLITRGIRTRNGSALASGTLWYIRPCIPQFLIQADKPSPTKTRDIHES
jgi:hypothetical protein